MRTSVQDIVSGSVFLVLSVVLSVLIPGQIRHVETVGLGARFLPTSMAQLLAVLSIILIIQGALHRRRELDAEPVSVLPEPTTVYVAGAVVSYVLLLSVVPYIPATIVSLCAVLFVLREKNLKLYFVLVLFIGVLYTFFTYALRVRLP